MVLVSLKDSILKELHCWLVILPLYKFANLQQLKLLFLLDFDMLQLDAVADNDNELAATFFGMNMFWHSAHSSLLIMLESDKIEICYYVIVHWKHNVLSLKLYFSQKRKRWNSGLWINRIKMRLQCSFRWVLSV